jgi:hypothetical protein
MCSKPAFVQLPAVGAARQGAAVLPATPTGVAGILEWRHTDDIVPSLFSRLSWKVPAGYVEAIQGWMRTKEFHYAPHHYDAHAEDIAQWLLNGVRPAVTVHDSHEDR